MKIIAFILLVACIQLSARVHAQTVTLVVKDVSAKEVIRQIQKQTGMNILISETALEEAGNLTLSVKNMQVAEVLKRCFNPDKFICSIVDRTIVIKLRKEIYPVQPSIEDTLQNITGQVKDEKDEPIAGVTIHVVGTKRGTISDNAGYFSLPVGDDDVIAVSTVGYLGLRFKVSLLPSGTITSHLISSGNLGEARQRAANEPARDIPKESSANSFVRNTDKGILIVLIPSVSSLGGVTIVLNTGYQSLPKERSTGSFSVVSADKIAQKSGSMNVVDRLEGLAPGISFNYGQGNDKILMRGASSVNLDRQPLIILDGIPVVEYTDIESLVNPQDINDITLLKDATAASIWGAQAANGVIVITTKTGQYNDDKINISYHGFVTFKGLPDYSSLNLMSSSDFIKANKELFSSSEYAQAFPYNTASVGPFPKIYPHEKIYYDLESGTINNSTANQSWDSLAALSNRAQIERYFYQPALLTSHSVSLSGGGRFNRFFSSLSYDRHNNNDRSTTDHYLIDLKEELKIAKWLTFDIAGNLSYERTHSLNITLPTGLSFDTYTPYAMFADGRGKPLSQDYLNMTSNYQHAAETKSQINLNYSPLDELNRNKNNSISIASRINSGLRLNLAKGLALSVRGLYQKTVYDGYNYYDQASYPVRLENVQFTQAPGSPNESPIHYLPLSGGHYYTSNTAITSWTIRNQLEYDGKIGEEHQVIALAGVEMRDNKFDITNTLTRGYNFQTQTYSSYNQKDLEVTGVSNAVLPQGTKSTNTLQSLPLIQAESELRFLSYYGNLAYAYMDRYNFNGSLRYDQSNLFGKASSSQNKPIWSVGASWDVQKEDFFKSNIINKLTPRITYGIAGNSPKPGLGGPFDILYAISTPMFDGLGPGYIIISPANSQLSWEKTKIFNLGIDFELLSYRILGSIDYYDKQSTDLLGDSPIDPTSGWYSYYGNVGNLYNKGVEISVTSRNISLENFSWTTNFNLAYNKSKITLLKRYRPLVATALVNGGFVEGYPAYSLFAYNYKGLDGNGNPIGLKKDGSTVSLTNQLSNDDVLFQGSTQPPWYGGITNTFTCGGFTLSGLIVYNLGNVMRNDVNKVYFGRLQANISNTFDDRWQKRGDEDFTDVPKYIPNQTTSESRRSTTLYTQGNTNVISASYVKLRDISLTYAVPLSASWGNVIKQLKVYAQINNVMIWTKNKNHIDPEYYDLSTGTRLPKMPPFYTIGINVSL